MLYEIFLICSRHDRGAPVVLSHVCRYWRETALATPTFWNNIVISGHQPNWEKHAAWIARSMDAPLHIAIVQSVFFPASLKKLRRVMQLILPHIDRWISFRFRCPTYKVYRVFMDALRGRRFPILESFEYDVLSTSMITPHRESKDPTSAWVAPKLHSFAMRPNLTFHSSPFFHNITSLSIRCQLIKQLSVIPGVQLLLSAHPQLRHLTLLSKGLAQSTLPLGSGLPSDVPLATFHGNIQELRLHQCSFFEILAQKMELPSLIDVSTDLDAQSSIGLKAGRAIAAWGSPSRLRAIETTEYLDMAVLSAMPCLEHLTIGLGTFGGIADAWPHALKIHCPRLRRLDFNTRRGIHGGRLVEMLHHRSRSEVVAPIRQVRLSSHLSFIITIEDVRKLEVLPNFTMQVASLKTVKDYHVDWSRGSIAIPNDLPPVEVSTWDFLRSKGRNAYPS